MSYTKRTRLVWTGISCAVSIGVVLIGAVCGSLVGEAIGRHFGSLTAGGAFIPWYSIGKPPGNVTSIVGASHQRVYVETEDQKVYSYDLLNNCTDPLSQECWHELSSPEKIRTEEYQQCWHLLSPPDPPDDAIQKAEASYCDSGNDLQAKYALRKDGSVWAWEYMRSDFDFDFVTVSVQSVAGLVKGFLVGLAVSTIILICYWLVFLYAVRRV